MTRLSAPNSSSPWSLQSYGEECIDGRNITTNSGVGLNCFPISLVASWPCALNLRRMRFQVSGPFIVTFASILSRYNKRRLRIDNHAPLGGQTARPCPTQSSMLRVGVCLLWKSQ